MMTKRQKRFKDDNVDEYDPIRMFRRDVFVECLHYLESKTLTESQVAGCLKNCIEFFVDGADNATIRDFCMAKLKEAAEHMR